MNHTSVIRISALGFVAACTSSSPGKPLPYVERVGVIGTAPPVTAATPDEVTVTVVGLRNDSGSVRCFLYDSADGFPESDTHIIGRAVALPKGRKGRCSFVGVARDRDYAIVVMHDEDNDGQMAKNLIGMPKEGYGFSNDVKPRLSAPSFHSCRFHFTSGSSARTVTAQY